MYDLRDGEIASAVGLRNKNIYGAAVHFAGAVDQSDGDIRAWVEAPDPPEIGYGRNALALLVPLAAAKIVYLTTNAPDYAAPTVETLDAAAERLLERPGDRELNLADPSLPTYVDGGEEKADAKWSATLVQSRKGGYWVKARGPVRGAPTFALWGVVGLIDHVARHADFEATVLPAMWGVRTLSEMAERLEWELLGRGGEDFLGEFVAAVVASDDPRVAHVETVSAIDEADRRVP